MFKDVIDLLKEKKYTLASAESFTGGLFAATMTSYAGVSEIFKGGVVSYWNEVKENVLKIDKGIIEKYGVVSKETASSMLDGVKELMKTDLAVSFTGNAGPTSLENKPCGLVYIGICFFDKKEIYELNLEGSREEIRRYAVNFALKKIKNILQKI